MIDINAAATQALAQGQSMLNSDLSNASNYQNQYNQYQAQADAANKNVSSYSDYMKNEGSAGNQYHTEQAKELGDLGYSEPQMTAARANLNQATGALSAYSDFANTSASKFGLNAGGFAAANAGALGGLNNNIASNQGVVNGLTDLYKTAQTGSNQFTGNVIQGEQTTLTGLQQVFTNATNQRDSAGSMMQFYQNLASQQGGLNAQQQQYYAQAKQAYAQATAAQAQAALYGAQASQIQQQIAMANKAAAQGASAARPSSPASPYANPGGPSLYQQLGSSRIGQDLATGALDVGHAVGGAASKAGHFLGGLF
jgi:hypothetical protein